MCGRRDARSGQASDFWLNCRINRRPRARKIRYICSRAGHRHRKEVAMGYARKALVSLADTPYYHVVARCVRRAWLWGFDEYAGREYSHRKAWVLERLAQLTSIFTIDICAY